MVLNQAYLIPFYSAALHKLSKHAVKICNIGILLDYVLVHSCQSPVACYVQAFFKVLLDILYEAVHAPDPYRCDISLVLQLLWLHGPEGKQYDHCKGYRSHREKNAPSALQQNYCHRYSTIFAGFELKITGLSVFTTSS